MLSPNVTPGPVAAVIPAARQRRAGLVPRVQQYALFCACGQVTPGRTGLCSRCRRVRTYSRCYFAGHREQVLHRDGQACRSCGTAPVSPLLHVHHRYPGVHDPATLVSLCAACHARLHHLRAVRRWLPEALLALWVEQRPGVPVQLQFPLTLPGVVAGEDQ